MNLSSFYSFSPRSLIPPPIYRRGFSGAGEDYPGQAGRFSFSGMKMGRDDTLKSRADGRVKDTPRAGILFALSHG